MEKTALDKARAFLSETKDGAVWLAMVDINDLVNYSAIARQYFNKSGNWLLQRLHGNVVNGKPATFKPHEARLLSDALRDMSARLAAAADRIDKADEGERAEDAVID